MSIKRYREVLDHLYDMLPVFHRTGAAAYKDNLDNARALDEMFGCPHRAFKSVHVGGTNGKGSVSHMLASILQEAGCRTGLYTSPHLLDFRERIRINGEMIPEQDVVLFVNRFLEKNEKAGIAPSFFELTVAMAFDHFRNRGVDIAVVEVGLGGRLDATNIILPEVSVITNVSLDHIDLLGKTVPLIAAEKAGIFKPGVPVLVSESNAEYDEVFERKAMETGSPLWFADREYRACRVVPFPESPERLQIFKVEKNGSVAFPALATDLPGYYQRRNIAGVLKTVDILGKKGWKIDRQALCRGLERVKANTGLRGRWETAGSYPRVICDTAHNAGGMALVVEQLMSESFDRLHFIIGMASDKDTDSILKLLPADARYYFTKADIPRALNPQTLRRKAEALGLNGEDFSSVAQAVAAALKCATAGDLVFVGGSTFVVADYLKERSSLI